MKLKRFLCSIPRLCLAPNADRWARLIEFQFDEELANPNSVFARNKSDVEWPANRLATAFGFPGDQGRIDHCKMLAEICMLSHYKHAHGENVWDSRIFELEVAARVTEEQYPDIAEVMSVDEAVALGGWNA